MSKLVKTTPDLTESHHRTRQTIPAKAGLVYLPVSNDELRSTHITNSALSLACGEKKEGYSIKEWERSKRLYQVHGWKVKRSLTIYSKPPKDRTITNLKLGTDNLFQGLERLKLSIDTKWRMEDKELESLTDNFITHFRNLRSLELTFWHINKLTGKGLRALALGVSHHLPNLTDFRLHLSSAKDMTDEGLQSLFYYVSRHLPNLKKFGFGLSWGEQITNQGLIALNSQISRRLNSLQSLHLHLYRTSQVTDEGIHALSCLLSRCFSSVQSLSLDLDWYRMSVFGFESLATSISKSFVNIRDFKLWSGADISEEGLEIFGDLLRDLQSKLYTLTLSFCEGRTTDKGLGAIMFGIMNYQPNLRSLDINCRECFGLTDESLQLFDLAKLPYLENLELQFTYCSKLTDQIFTNLPSRSKDHVSRLKILTLYFVECDVTDLTLEAFACLFSRSFLYLWHCDLSLRGCEKITNQGLQTLALAIKENLQHLQYLTYFHLDLGDSQVTKKYAEEVEEALFDCGKRFNIYANRDPES